MAFPAPLLLPILLPAERVINAALQTDEISRNRLSELNDKVIAIHETSLDIHLGIAVVANEVQLLNEYDGVSDVKLTGDKSALLALMKSSDALYGSGIRIEGQLSDAEALRSIVSQLDIDTESLLAPIAGGTIAHQAGRFVESASAWFRSASDRTQSNVKDYLQEEADILVPPLLTQEFTDQVTELREGVDRAEARLRRLEQRKLTKSSENLGSSGVSSSSGSTGSTGATGATGATDATGATGASGNPSTSGDQQ